MPRWRGGYALKEGNPRSLEAPPKAPPSIPIMMNADHYMNNLLPKLIEDCDNLMPHNFIFRQDGAQTHTTFGTGLNRTAKSRLHTKINGPLTHQISILLTFMSGEPCWKVPGLLAKTKKQSGIEGGASSDLGRLSSRGRSSWHSDTRRAYELTGSLRAPAQLSYHQHHHRQSVLFRAIISFKRNGKTLLIRLG